MLKNKPMGTLRKITIALIFLLLMGGVGACTKVDPIRHSKKLLSRALKSMEDKDFHKAIVTLKYVMHLNPQLRDAYYYMGLSYYSIGSVADALSSFRLYAKYFPEHLETRIKLAEMSYISGDYDYFFENVEILKKLDPDNFKIVELLGDYYYGKHDDPASIYYYTKVINKDKTNVDARFRLAKIYFRKNNIDLAKKLLAECDVLSPNNEKVITFFYDIYKREGNFSKVLENLNILLKFRKGDAKLGILKQLAYTYFTREMPRESMIFVRKILLMEPEDPMSHYIVGKIAYEQGDYNKALKELRIAANMSFQPIDARFLMGKIYQKLNQPLNAIDEFREITYLDGSFFEAHAILAELYIGFGKYDLAISEAYDMLRLRLTYEHPDAYYYLGISYFKKEIYSRAIGYLTDYLKYEKTSPRAAEANYYMAVSHMRRIVKKSSLDKPMIDSPIYGKIIEEEEPDTIKNRLLEMAENKSGIERKKKLRLFIPGNDEAIKKSLGENVSVKLSVVNAMIFENLPLSDPIPFLDEAIRINSMYADAYVLRAIINHARGNLFLAIDDAKRAIEFRSSNIVLCNFVLGNIYVSMGNLAKAIENFRKAKELLPGFEISNLSIINCFDTKKPTLVSKLSVAMFMIINKWYDDAVYESNKVLGYNPKNKIAIHMNKNIYLIKPPI